MLGKHNVLKRVWPKLWFNLNVYMQFHVCLLTLYFRLLHGSLMSMATKLRALREIIFYLLALFSQTSICSWPVSSSALNTFLCGEHLITLVLAVFDICATSFANPTYLCITGPYINSAGLCWCLVPDSAGHVASILSLCSYDATYRLM